MDDNVIQFVTDPVHGFIRIKLYEDKPHCWAYILEESGGYFHCLSFQKDDLRLFSIKTFPVPEDDCFTNKVPPEIVQECSQTDLGMIIFKLIVMHKSFGHKFDAQAILAGKHDVEL